MILLNTTSTGPSASYTLSHPSDLVAMQVTRTSTAAVATTVTLQGSIDGNNWVSLGAQQSYTSTGTSIYVSTGTYLVGQIRVTVGAHSATGAISVETIALRN